MWKSGKVEIRKCGNQEMWKSGNVEIRKCGNREMWKSGNVEIRKCENQEMWKSGNVDDFIMAGTKEFLEEITEKIAKKLEISKLEDNEFRFTGMDVKKDGDVIVVSMEEYAKSLEKVE